MNRRINFVVIKTRNGDVQVMYDGKHYSMTPAQATFSNQNVEKGSLSAPMPGKIVKIFVQEGAKVKAGDPLLILEAMKMEVSLN